MADTAHHTTAALIPSSVPTDTLVVAGVSIQRDNQGRYNLNTLHQASQAGDAKKPGNWLKRKSTQALISELDTQVSFLTLDVVHGGERSGTYAHELLAVSYAGWIAPAFQLRVNQAFLDIKRGATVPIVRDHRTQIAIETLVRLDEAEYQITLLKQDAHEKALQLERTEAKIETAVNNQNFWTVAEYVQYHDLRHQCPESAYAEASRHMRDYCKRERLNYRDPNILPRRIPVGEKGWESEWGFHTSVYEAAFLPWLTRRSSQVQLVPKEKRHER